MLALQPDVTNVDDTTMPYIYLNNAMLLAKYFDKRQNMKSSLGLIFTLVILRCTFSIIFWKSCFHGLQDFIPYMDHLR